MLAGVAEGYAAAMKWMLALVLVVGCSCDDGGGTPECTMSSDCTSGQICIDGQCRPSGERDGGSDMDGQSQEDTGEDCAEICGEACCAEGEVCDGTLCRRDEGTCFTSNDCPNDSRCQDTRCLGYEPDERDSTCTLLLEPGIFRSVVQCEWTGPPEGDSYPDHNQVSTMPLVVDFAIGRSPDDFERQPSIVFHTFGPGGNAVVRIIDGRTCEHQWTLEGFVPTGRTMALGDLTGNGRADIVAPADGGGIRAWTYDEAMSDWRELFRSEDRSATLSHDLSVADLDDDATPEIIAGALVYNTAGELLGGDQGETVCSGGYATPGVITDVDHDGVPERVAGAGVYAWNGSAWELEPYWTGPGRSGYTAVADFGEFPDAATNMAGRPEIAVVSLATISIYTIAGELVFGPIGLAGGRDGGNPTIADFDGDGRREVATGTPGAYTVVDLDCAEDGVIGTCASARTDGILWAAPVQDSSCGINGSTVFDFEADGRAEAIYADECYIRVLDGTTGDVLWSHRRNSATWVEAPIVADADGDFHAEIISPSSSPGHGCPAEDTLYAGMRCESGDDCPSGTCDAGLCRCEMNDQCGDPELRCLAPLAGTEGTGNVCRTVNADQILGIRVYADILDRWAPSRAIWNQHAYHVTNISDRGVVPQSSMMQRNWETEGLNNFRQNVQGDIEPGAAADATIRGLDYSRDCSEENPVLELHASVCNRGGLPLASGLRVAFEDAAGIGICTTTTTMALGPGDCEAVSCVWNDPPLNTPNDVTVTVDGDETAAECREQNNTGTIEDVQCPPPLQ